VLNDKTFCTNGDNVQRVVKVLGYMADQDQEIARKLVAAGKEMLPQIDLRLKKNISDLIAKYE
jgi:hypothetical protein